MQLMTAQPKSIEVLSEDFLCSVLECEDPESTVEMCKFIVPEKEEICGQLVCRYH
jgi:hypothetical protein